GPTPVDGCDSDATITSNDAPACFPIGTTTVHWTVTDNDDSHAPLTGMCSSTVTVVADAAPPTFDTFPANATVECTGAVTDTSPMVTGTPGASDTCDTAHVTHSDGMLTTDDCTGPGHPRYHFTRTWTATDDCNNVRNQDQLITVVD